MLSLSIEVSIEDSTPNMAQVKYVFLLIPYCVIFHSPVAESKSATLDPPIHIVPS